MESHATPISPQAESIPAAPDHGLWSRIGNVFFSPTKAFEGFRGRAGILVPLLIITIVLSVIMALPVTKYQGLEQIKMLEQSTTLPPQVLEQARERASHPNYIASAIGAPIVVLLIGVISALIAWLFGGFFFGGKKAGFGTIWGVTLLSGLISLVGGVLRVPLIIAKESARVSFGPAALLSGMQPTAIFFMIMSLLDIFAIWSLIAAGFGYSEIFGLSRAKGMWISVIAFVVVMGGFITLQLVGLMLAGVEITFF
jgi:hypothetical protein